MRRSDETNSSVGRRAILERVGAGSLLATGSVPVVSASSAAASTNDGSGDDIASEPTVDPVALESDGDGTGIANAEIRLHGDGSVTKELRFEAELPPGRGAVGGEERTGGASAATTYSLDLALEEPRTVRRRARRDGEFGLDGFTATLERERRPVESVVESRAGGIPGGPEPGDHDFATFCHTKSRECGPLARTNSLATVEDGLCDRAFDREMVDGDACEGAEWDSTFEAFCDVAQYVPGLDCSVPSVFDTTWNAPVRLRDESAGSMSVGTVFTCGNFPAIPETVVSVHRVETELEGSTVAVDWAVTHGIVPWNDASDYDLDWNGIANVVVDGLSAAFPTEPYSFVLAQYLLADDGGIVI